jgi:hypothetical protein
LAKDLTSIGLKVHPIQSFPGEPKSKAMFERIWEECGTELDLDDFIDGKIKPSGVLILYAAHDRPLPSRPVTV